MVRDIRVDEHSGHIYVYDKLGSGSLTLSEDEAEYIQERLSEVLGDDE